MIDWIKNISKNYPEFWKNYLESFHEKPTRIVSLSIEATGSNPSKDYILSIGAISIVDNRLLIEDSFEVNILQNLPDSDEALSNNFSLASTRPKITENAGIERFVNYLSNAIIVGHRINFDIDIINAALHKLDCGKLKNEIFDIEAMYRKHKELVEYKNISLDDLSEEFKIPKSDRISSIEDAYTIALIFIKLKNKLGLFQTN